MGSIADRARTDGAGVVRKTGKAEGTVCNSGGDRRVSRAGGHSG